MVTEEFKVCFVRSYQIDVDSRLKRYQGTLSRKGVDFVTIYWDRHGVGGVKQDEVPIAIRAKVGGGASSIVSIIRFQVALLWKLISRRRSYDLLHVVDLDTVLPSFVVSRLFGKPIVFDIYDKYTETRGIGGLAAKLIDGLENYFCNNVDLLILPDEARRRQHSIAAKQNVCIIENVPQLKIHYQECPPFDAEPLRLVYAGVLERTHRGIEDLLKCVSRRSDCSLDIAGFGALSELAREYSDRYPNIHFHGKLSPDACMSLMRESHVIFGMYYKTVPNNLYAAPNKYYEHLILGRPLVTTLGTPPGEKVLLHDTGWVIDEGVDAIDRVLDEMFAARGDISRKGELARKLWLNVFFQLYGENGFDRLYLDALNVARNKS